MRENAEKLVFIDETGLNTKMTRTHGPCLKGQRLFGKAPFKRWGNQTLIAGLNRDGILAPWMIKGAMDRDAFDTYIERRLRNGAEFLILRNLIIRFGPLSFQRTQSV